MLTHSLLKHGLDFKEAFAVANITRERLMDLAEASESDLELSADELREFVWRLVADKYGEERMRQLASRRPEAEPAIDHPEGQVPFSRGLLSQKLVGTGLDPRAAYEVAQEVFTQLRASPGARIDDQQLRELERRILVEHHGESFGQRYDTIDLIARSNRPIVLLIGGATGCGKSTLAMEIAYRLGIRKVASTDMIREIMRKLLSPDILPSLHASSYRVMLPHPQADPAIAGFLEQASRVEVGISASIRRAVLENFHLIVEGVHVVRPEVFEQEFRNSAIIVPVTLATMDRSVLESRFIRRSKEIASERRAKRYLAAVDDIMRIQEFVLDHADRNDVPIIQNISFDEAAAELLRTVTDRIHEIVHSKAWKK
ncbi:MAG: hypothetical protein ACOC1F_08110 [Myxococcota bacterium]